MRCIESNGKMNIVGDAAGPGCVNGAICNEVGATRDTVRLTIQNFLSKCDTLGMWQNPQTMNMI